MAERFSDQKFLSGNFAPIRFEADAPDLEIEGDFPESLRGTLYRNGPNPQFSPRDRYHIFSGDGMIHAFSIADGRVSYRNRWVRTNKWKLENAAGRALFGTFGNPMTTDPSVHGESFNVANTNILAHGGRLLALEEGNPPFELAPDSLESIGPWDFSQRLVGPMTAHPKIDPHTGEMLFFGYGLGGMGSPEMRLNVVAADGTLTRADTFEAPYASMVHDFVVTENWIVFPIFPATMNLERAIAGGPPIAWEPDRTSRLGLLRRDRPIEELRWIEAEACYVFHPMNAFEEEGRLRVDFLRYDSAPGFPGADGGRPDPTKAIARLERWSIDLEGDGVTIDVLDDLASEFPRLDERYAGLPYRHGYMASTEGEGGRDVLFDQLVHVDLHRQSFDRWHAGKDAFVSEPIFVPRGDDAPEGEGFVLAVVYLGADNRSDLMVFDASHLAAGPIGRARLDHRVPFGFHGNWVGA